jgi:adenylate cyclase, class 1
MGPSIDGPARGSAVPLTATRCTRNSTGIRCRLDRSAGNAAARSHRGGRPIIDDSAIRHNSNTLKLRGLFEALGRHAAVRNRPDSLQKSRLGPLYSGMAKHSRRRGAGADETMEKRFLTINHDRLRRVYDNLTPRQRDFLDILPLLFHINHPLLPGYVSKTTPSGINDYAPARPTIRATRRLCRSFDYDRRSVPTCAIRGLYMLGSPGTIAYSRNSDLDMWLCHDPELEAGAVELLVEKSQKIERFAAGLDLEVHFFVFDADGFRRGETLPLSTESSGSSQHYLLLDEFYRSSLLVAGLKPLWWRVPRTHDADYDDFVAEAFEKRLIDRSSYIDFGGLSSIPAEEFFGAAVWHLYKSIQSPYKSVMKLLLMEAYAAEYPNITLLSQHYKRNIESKEVDLNAVDPYVLMYTKAEEHLKAQDDPVRLDVLRRCFYLKTHLTLSDNSPGADVDWRGAVLAGMTQSWGWTEHQVNRLDQRDAWRIDDAIEERRDLINTLKESYSALSQFARNHSTDSKITEHDLHVLGRKLYAAFEKKPAKVEVLTGGICTNPVESTLSLHEVRRDDGNCSWILFSGIVKPSEIYKQKPMKRCSAAAELLTWCHLNRLSDAQTVWHIFASGSELNATEIKRLSEALQAEFPSDNVEDIAGDLSARPRLAKVVLFANVGINPFSGSQFAGGVLTSDHTDAFQYGGRRTNLVHAIDLVFSTTWSETFCFHYEGGDALLQALAECLQWLPMRGDDPLPIIETRCFASDRANHIEERVGATANGALEFLARNAAQHTPHFIIEIENQLHRIHVAKGTAQVETHSGRNSLINALGKGTDARFNMIKFDSSCHLAGILPDVYAHNRDGRVQVFAQARTGRADVYVLDERGLLLVQHQDCYTVEALLQHYRRFLESALPRCFGTPADDEQIADIKVDTAEIITTDQGPRFKPYVDDLAATTAYLSVQVLADADSNGHQQFTIYCGHKEFSTWDYGGSLFVAVAEYIRSCRSGAEAYPIYITDLDLSMLFRNLIGVESLRSLDLLSYKKRIEIRLTRAMKSESITDVPVALAS